MTAASKTEQIREAVRKGDKKSALKIAGGFRPGIFTPDQQRAIKKGYECLHYGDTYRQMGIDVEAAITHAWTLLSTLPVIIGESHV